MANQFIEKVRLPSPFREYLGFRGSLSRPAASDCCHELLHFIFCSYSLHQCDKWQCCFCSKASHKNIWFSPAETGDCWVKKSSQLLAGTHCPSYSCVRDKGFCYCVVGVLINLSAVGVLEVKSKHLASLWIKCLRIFSAFQLCVNVTNERLRQYVSEVLFQQEQAECQQEGIATETPCSPGNHSVVLNFFLQVGAKLKYWVLLSLKSILRQVKLGYRELLLLLICEKERNNVFVMCLCPSAETSGAAVYVRWRESKLAASRTNSVQKVVSPAGLQSNTWPLSHYKGWQRKPHTQKPGPSLYC